MFLRPMIVAGMLVTLLTGSDDAKVMLVSPTVLHGLAESVVLPRYPDISRKAKHIGVAVTEIVVSRSGKVIKTEVLQAPDDAIAAEVNNAVKQWTFHPFLTSGTPVLMKSRLIFYFRIVDGKPSVIDAVAENHAFGPTSRQIGLDCLVLVNLPRKFNAAKPQSSAWLQLHGKGLWKLQNG